MLNTGPQGRQEPGLPWDQPLTQIPSLEWEVWENPVWCPARREREQRIHFLGDHFSPWSWISPVGGGSCSMDPKDVVRAGKRREYPREHWDNKGTSLEVRDKEKISLKRLGK